MNLGLGNVWPLGRMGPVDFRIKINSTEMAVINEWGGVKSWTKIPFDSVSTDLPHRVHRTFD